VRSYTEEARMATNLAIDDRLIEEARRIGRHSTKKAAVTAALDEYIRRRKQKEIVELFGRIDFEGEYDQRASRRRDRAGDSR
jgi:Arc/MetJ family transcription regulator